MSEKLTYKTQSGSTTTLDRSNTIALLGCGKSKRSPSETTPDGEEIVQTQLTNTDASPQTWPARDLYTSTYFAKKREFGDYITQWATTAEKYRMAILSAKHHVIPHKKQIGYYDQSIRDLSQSTLTAEIPNNLSAVDGSAITSDYDLWVRNVALSLQEWLSTLTTNLNASDYNPEAIELVILAGSDYTQPLKDTVFEYGLSNLSVDVNSRDWITTVTPRYLFDEIPAGGNGEQIGWLNDQTPDDF